MVKTIRKTIQITTRKRNNSVKINEEFYSYDKKNAQFEFLMDYDVPADKVIALFHFENSNRYYETLCQFKGNLITIEFDTSLIVEDELVTGYLYFDKLDKSTDVYRFTFGVRLSEIDKTRELPVQEKVSRRIVPVEDIATKTDVREMLKSLRIEHGAVDNDTIESLINSKVNDKLLRIKDNLLDINTVQQNQGETNNTIFRTIEEIKERFNNLSNIYLQSHQSLEHLATNDALGKIEQRVEQLEQNRGNDNHDFITRQELEGKHYLTSVPEEYAKKSELYNDSALSERVSLLEAKAIANGAYNDKPLLDKIHEIEEQFRNASNLYLQSHQSLEHLVTKKELEDKHYLTSVPEEYAKKSELYNDSALSERVSLLEAKAIANGAYNDKPLLDKIHEIEEQFRNASNLYLQSHQSLEHLVTKKELEDKHYLTSVPEEYAKKTDLYNDSELRNKITQLETNSVTKEKVESVENRVQVLENKSVVTHEELESAGYAKTTDLTNLAANSKVEAVESRVLALENKPAVIPQGYDDSALSGRVSALEAKQDKDTIYNDEEIKRRLTTLEGKTDNFITGVSVNKEGSNVTLTYNYVDGQTKNVSFTDSDTVNVAYDDSGLKQRITNLENRPQVEAYNDADIKQRLTALENNHVTKEQLHEATELDETQFVSPDELEAKHYLTATQADSVYAKKTELYNDSALASRVSALESKQDNDTVYNDTEIKQRLTNLENRPQVDLTDYAKKTEIPNTTNFATADSVSNLLRTQGEQTVKISALEAKSAYDIHGTGMPNGQVEAPIGTTYVDMNVTNGALKWIKEKGSGNTGWKVLIGDTGWRTLNSISKLIYGGKTSTIKIRRVNNLVSYNFGGLQWGWFGIIRRNGPGFARHNSTGDRGVKVLGPGGIPSGFRSASSLIGSIYSDLGKQYGIWYLGGVTDANFIQFTFNDPIPTDKDIGDIRVSAISYVTDEDWPTTLPPV